MHKMLPFIVLLAAAAVPVSAQETVSHHSAFGCSEGAVSIGIDKHPSLRFKQLDAAPELLGFSGGHKFIFTGEGPFLFVTVYLTATLPEDAVGRASTAQLGLYVQTAASADDYHSGRKVQWWVLEDIPKPGTSGSFDDPSAAMVFDAGGIAGCFLDRGECEFAKVELVTPSPQVPLISVGFTEDFGGATSSSTSETQLLLDFRSSPPSVASTAVCEYNEGGGGCTAVDSGDAARAKLQCDWKEAEGDLLCSKELTNGYSGHSDFYLLGNKEAPLREDEVASLSDALAEFESSGHEGPINVRGIGPVSWIAEQPVRSQRSVVVLGSASGFYFVPKFGKKAGAAATVRPHVLLEEKPLPNGLQSPLMAKPNEWTMSALADFSGRPIFRDRGLTVLQVVKKDGQYITGLYWLGMDFTGPAPAFDVLQLAGGGEYAGCGDYDVQATAVSTGRMRRTREAALRIQPETQESENGSPVEWKGEANGSEAVNCVRPGLIWWEDHKFQSSVGSGDCSRPEEPRYIKINGDGTVTLSEKQGP